MHNHSAIKVFFDGFLSIFRFGNLSIETYKNKDIVTYFNIIESDLNTSYKNFIEYDRN